VFRVTDLYETYAEVGIVVAILGTFVAIAFNVLRTRFETTSRFRVLHAFERSPMYERFSERYSVPRVRAVIPRWSGVFLSAILAIGIAPLLATLLAANLWNFYPSLQVGVLWFVLISAPSGASTAFEWWRFESAIGHPEAAKADVSPADVTR
jgi:hypothetical protein